MENASDAIIMAGAMLIFVIALTVAMTVFSTARETVDAVVYASDETNYYLYIDSSSSSDVKSRIVGLETIIPTLYKYYKEDYTVVFLDQNGNGLHLYATQTNPLNWSGYSEDTGIPTIASKYPGISTETANGTIWICSFDVDEETARREPWTGSTTDYKANLDAFLQGSTFNYPSGSGSYNYSTSFAKEYSDWLFIETIGTYSTEINDGSLSTTLDEGVRNNNTKRVIVYQLYKKTNE